MRKIGTARTFAVLLFVLLAGVTRSERDILTIGIVPETNIFTARRQYEALSDYISHKLDIEVKAEFLPSYGRITERFIKKEIDAGFFGSLSYAVTGAHLKIEPLVRPVKAGGVSEYSGYIFVRKASGIKNAGDLKGKRLVLVDKATTAGYVFPLAYFKKQGIVMTGDYFSRVYFAGSHDAACWAVYIGEADAGACKNLVFDKLAGENPDFRDKMLILAESVSVPQNALAVSRDFDPWLKEKLKNLLLDLDKSAEGKKILQKFGAVKFIETRESDYGPLYKMIEEAGIDLKTYPYK